MSAPLDQSAQVDRHHNEPPLAERLGQDLHEAWYDLEKRRDKLLASVARMPAAVNDDAMAGRFADQIKLLGAAAKIAEDARVTTKEPHLAACRIIDGFFKGITDPLTKAKKGAEAKLTVYQRAKAEAERKRREEEARQAREEAERKAREAAKAAADDAAREQAEKAAAEAQKAEKAAAAAPAELSRTQGSFGSTASLRTSWTFEAIDRQQIDLEALRPHLADAAIEQAVRAFIRAGGRELRGVRIVETQSAVVR